MKKLLSIILATATILSLAACSSKTTPEKGNTSTTGSASSEITTVKEGTLTVATSPDFAPCEFYAIGSDGKPTLAGYDISLAQYIANYLHLKLDIIPMDFDGVIMELSAGNVDIGVSGLAPDPKRADSMDFSDIYYSGKQSLVTVKKNQNKWKQLSDLNQANTSIGVQTGSVQQDLATKNTPKADIVKLAKVTDIISELLSGKLDAGYVSTDVAKFYQNNYPNLYIAFDVPYKYKGSAVGVTKGNKALLDGVNRAIAVALKDGSMDKFVAKANEQTSGKIYEGMLNSSGNPVASKASSAG